MEQIGIIPGGTISSQQEYLDAGIEMGKIDIKLAEIPPEYVTRTNDWFSISDLIGVYGTNYIVRALVTDVGLGANMAEDAIYLIWKKLDGAKQWIIHFKSPPPVNAFWSITTYYEGYLVTDGSGQIATIGNVGSDPVLEDGAFDIYIQSEDPGDNKLWLPIVANEICSLTARLYWPKDQVLDGTWRLAAVLPLAGDIL